MSSDKLKGKHKMILGTTIIVALVVLFISTLTVGALTYYFLFSDSAEKPLEEQNIGQTDNQATEVIPTSSTLYGNSPESPKVDSTSTIMVSTSTFIPTTTSLNDTTTAIPGKVECATIKDCPENTVTYICKEGNVIRKTQSFYCTYPGTEESRCKSREYQYTEDFCQKGERCIDGMIKCQSIINQGS
ncbi:MAG: hypothetical protein ABH950_05755 [Candidatus Altiarchaeota archaeon]